MTRTTGRKKSAATEPEQTDQEKRAAQDLAATDESAPGGRIKASAGTEFEYAADHQVGEPDGPAVVWNPHAAGFVIDHNAPKAEQSDGPAGGGIQLSPEVPQGDPTQTDTENVVEQQRHVDVANTTPDQYAPGTPGVPAEAEPEHKPKSVEPTV